MTDKDNNDTDLDVLRANINNETSQINWNELQRFFAGGWLIYVSQQTNLLDVAIARLDIFGIERTAREHPGAAGKDEVLIALEHQGLKPLVAVAQQDHGTGRASLGHGFGTHEPLPDR